MTDADGVPLVVQTTPANVNDDKQLPALLDGPSQNVRRGQWDPLIRKGRKQCR